MNFAWTLGYPWLIMSEDLSHQSSLHYTRSGGMLIRNMKILTKKTNKNTWTSCRQKLTDVPMNSLQLHFAWICPKASLSNKKEQSPYVSLQISIKQVKQALWLVKWQWRDHLVGVRFQGGCFSHTRREARTFFCFRAFLNAVEFVETRVMKPPLSLCLLYEVQLLFFRLRSCGGEFILLAYKGLLRANI